jgi:predicted NAD/FAD-binding protein
LLTIQDRRRLQWKTVAGGSHTYLKAFLKSFKGQVHTGAQIAHIRRLPADQFGPNGEPIWIRMRDSRNFWFDRVIIATHADEALKLLSDPSVLEKKLLGAWTYSQNHTILHTDARVLPPTRRAWAAWNYTEELETSPEHPVSVSYYMNALQGLDTSQPYCVTLNRTKPIDERFVIKDMIYTHPVYSFEALASQQHLPDLNGTNNTYFCGSYFGYGFHEDAVRSSVQMVREHFGVEWPPTVASMDGAEHPHADEGATEDRVTG